MPPGLAAPWGTSQACRFTAIPAHSRTFRVRFPHGQAAALQHRARVAAPPVGRQAEPVGSSSRMRRGMEVRQAGEARGAAKRSGQVAATKGAAAARGGRLSSPGSRCRTSCDCLQLAATKGSHLPEPSAHQASWLPRQTTLGSGSAAMRSTSCGRRGQVAGEAALSTSTRNAQLGSSRCLRSMRSDVLQGPTARHGPTSKLRLHETSRHLRETSPHLHRLFSKVAHKHRHIGAQPC